MAKRIGLQPAYSRGSVQDLPRHLLPRYATWTTTDYIPDHGAPLRKRGGWGYASPAFGAVAPAGAAWAPFSAGSQLIGVLGDSGIYKIAGGVATLMGTGNDPGHQRPIFFNNQIIIPGTGSSSITAYDGTTVSTIAGAPTGQYGDSYKARLILAGTAANPNLLYFSDILDTATWDLTNTYITMTNPIRGIASLRNAILVFEEGITERIRGDIPPPGGDMVREPLFQVGCIDARSIVSLGDKVIWASSEGVWISDGAAIDNLIALGGMQQYWETLFESYTSSWTVAAGSLRGRYIVSIMDGLTPKVVMMCDIGSKTWSFLSNLDAVMFAEAYGSTPETYVASASEQRIYQLSQIFDPSSSNQNDADGTAVQPTLETGFFRGTPGSRRFKNLIVGNYMSAANGSTTYLKTSYITEPESTSYTTVVDDTGATVQIPVNGAFTRSKLPLHVASDGIALKIEQVGASYDTMLFDLEGEIHEREASR